MLNWLFGNDGLPPRKRVEPTISNVADSRQLVVTSDTEAMLQLFGEPLTPAGAQVNDKSAMRVSVVYACVRLIAGAIASLPLPIYERTADGRKAAQHNYWWLFNERPSANFSASAFWEAVASQVLLRGDSVAYLARNAAFQVTSVILWPRDLVSIQRIIPDDPKKPVRLRYYFQALDGYFGAEQEDVLHFPGFGFNGWQSMSVIQWGARAGIGIAMKGDEFAGKFFGQGAQPQFAVKVPGEMSIPQQDAFRDAWVKKYSGNGPNGVPLILTEGLDVTQLTMSAVDAQVIESRQWQVVDIARAFGVPPYMIGETDKQTSFGAGVEHMGIGFVKYTLMPHLKRFQQEINHKLFLTDRYYAEFNVDGLMQADAKGRSEYFKSALGGTQSPAWMTPNEVRKLENLPPIDGGDDLSKPKDTPNAQASPAAAGG